MVNFSAQTYTVKMQNTRSVIKNETKMPCMLARDYIPNMWDAEAGQSRI